MTNRSRGNKYLSELRKAMDDFKKQEKIIPHRTSIDDFPVGKVLIANELIDN